MTTLDVVNSFVDVLLRDPEPTMQAIRLRLSATDYELVLKKADVLKQYEKQWKPEDEDAPYLFPLHAEDKGILVK